MKWWCCLRQGLEAGGAWSWEGCRVPWCSHPCRSDLHRLVRPSGVGGTHIYSPVPGHTWGETHPPYSACSRWRIRESLREHRACLLETRPVTVQATPHSGSKQGLQKGLSQLQPCPPKDAEQGSLHFTPPSPPIPLGKQAWSLVPLPHLLSRVGL